MSHSDKQLRDPAELAHEAARRRPGAVRRRVIHRIARAGGRVALRRARDLLATEEPLEIVVAGAAGDEPLSVTMRTPGADFDLVAGSLFAEGIIQTAGDLLAMRYCSGRTGGAGRAERPAAQPYNRVEVCLAGGSAVTAGRSRRALTTSSCGVCGMGSIEAVMELACPMVDAGEKVTADLLLSLPPRLREAQALFERTGGLHAAALFDLDGTLMCIREDVGRHNAMDKLVGAALLAGDVPLRNRVLLLSGRLSFELVQKAARAGIPVVAGVSAPSTLAVELAERTGITLIGFLRDSGFNVYAGGGRIDVPVPQARHRTEW